MRILQRLALNVESNFLVCFLSNDKNVLGELQLFHCLLSRPCILHQIALSLLRGGARGEGERGQGEESLITSSRTTILRFTSHETNNYVFTLYKLEVVQYVTSKRPDQIDSKCVWQTDFQGLISSNSLHQRNRLLKCLIVCYKGTDLFLAWKVIRFTFKIRKYQKTGV